MKVIAGIMAMMLLIHPSCENKELKEPELIPMHTTAYCSGTITASGTKVRKGICAVNKERMYQLAIVYENVDGKPGQILGYYECLDTGFGADSDGNGIGSIQEGKVIDIYQPTLEECYDWMRLTNGKVLVQFIEDAKG